MKFLHFLNKHIFLNIIHTTNELELYFLYCLTDKYCILIYLSNKIFDKITEMRKN